MSATLAIRLSAHAEDAAESVLVLDGAPAAAEPTDDELLDALASARAAGATVRDAAAAVAGRLGVSKRRVYELATRS